MKLVQAMALVLLSTLLLLSIHSASAQRRAFAPRLENFDSRAADGAAEARAQRDAAQGLAHLRQHLPDARVEFDRITRAPAFIRSSDGFLSGTGGLGRGITAASHAGLTPNDPYRPTKAFLREHRGLFGYGTEALAEARVMRDSTAPHNGVKTVVWQQQVDSIPLFEAVLVSHTTKNGELISVESHFVPDPIRAADTAMPNRARLVAAPAISAEQAVALAAKNAGDILEAEGIRRIRAADGPEKRQWFLSDGLRGETEVKLVWLPLSAMKLRLSWDVILTSRRKSEMFRVLVDAQSGEVWLRHSLTAYFEPASFRVFTGDSPSPFSPGYPAPSTNQPPLVPRVLVGTNIINTTASPNGWINDGDNETRGNNVDAHTDLDADDQPDLPRPQGSVSRVFDFPIDLTQPPSSYSSAAIVQLFYWCNWMHDRLYELGFTEAAGNFQVDNFGRGGLDNDPVQADAQDGSGVNNANMSTPPDGSSPRMQMYLFTGPNPARDGDFDAEVVLHEYTHGLSNRRVGGGVGINRLQSAGMGEGWSDFYALALLSEVGDDVDGVYAAGGYLSYQLSGELENYYYGIRRYPYSTDLAKNPLTLKDIDPAQAIEHTGVPLNPADRPFSPSLAAEVHNQGEVWCVTLWDARANLIKKHGFTNGNRLILQLVTDGMSFSPANPNFLQARDGILMADRVNNNGANLDQLWAAFAKRGMGVSATSPSSSTTGSVRESFDPPDDLVIRPAVDFSSGGLVGGPFNPASQTYSLTNVGTNAVVWTVTRSAGWLTVSPSTGSIPAGGASVPVAVSLDNSAGSLGSGIYTDTVAFSNAATHVTQTRLVTLRVGLVDSFTEWFQSGDNDLDFQSFTFTPDGSPGFYSMCRQTVTNFFTPTNGGTTVTLTDDSFTQVTLSNNAAVSIYGNSSNVFFIGSNGYLTQGNGDLSLTESASAHFNLRRVSGLFTDLDPSRGGAVTWKQLSDRVAVTWFNVPQYATSLSNSFQIEMFFNGTIRLTYLSIASSNGLAGLSAGLGVPEGFAESDFSNYSFCGMPALALTLPGQVQEGTAVLSGQGAVGLLTPVATNVTIRLTSSDPGEFLVPSNVVVLAGETNALFDVIVPEDSELDGTQNVIVTANAPGFLGSLARVRVFDNETAALRLSLPVTTIEGAGSVTGRVSLSTIPSTGIAVSLTSSDTNELQVPPTVIIPAGATSVVFIATVVNDTRIDGAQNVVVTAHVANWQDAAAAIVVLDDEPLNLTLTVPPRTREGRGVLTNAGTVQLAGTLRTNLPVSLLSSDMSELTVPSLVTILAGNTSASFDLGPVDDAEVDGTSTVTITANAPGFAGGTAVIDVFDNETPLPPAFPFPPHLASNVEANVALAWSGGEFTELLVNGDFEKGDFTGWARVPSLAGNFQIHTATNDPPSPDGPLPPFEGTFSAMAQQTGPGIHEMYQDVVLPGTPNRIVLNWADRARNFFARFDSNQQYRVEIRTTNNAVLALAHTTMPGDPLLGDWVTRTFDLTPFAGQTIRIAFVVNPGGYFLDVYVDNVSVAVSTPGSTSFDVYFGPNPTPGPAEFRGTTTNTTFTLPTLAPQTTYYWQIVARTLGQISGPVWQFTTRGVDRFDWTTITSPQFVNEPFNVTITAKDSLGTTVSNFTGAVNLSALSGFGPGTIFSEDFEEGNIDGWSLGNDPSVFTVTSETAAGGSFSLTANGGVNVHRGGLVHTLPNVRPDEVRFAVRASRTDASGGYFVLGTGTNRSQTAAFFFMNNSALMGIYEDKAFGHQRPYLAGRWYNISLLFSWANKTLDYYVDGLLVERGIPFRGTDVDFLSRVYLYNFDYTQSWWDEIQFLTNGVPIRIALDPTTSGVFTNGAWHGEVGLRTAANHVSLRAEDTGGHSGLSTPFNVVTRNDLGVRIEFTQNPAVVLGPVTYIVSAFNSGPSSADGVFLTNLLPAGATLLDFVATQESCARVGDRIVCDFGTLPGGAEAVLTFRVAPTGFGLLTNRAEVARAQVDGDLSNNSAVAVTAIAMPLLTIGDAYVNEGDFGVVNAQFLVTLSASNPLPVTVNFTTANGTAVSGADYVQAQGLLNFSPGVTQQVNTVQINGDTNAESDESFSVILNGPVNAGLARYLGTGVIIDNDQAAVATMPFIESWEGATVRPFWLRTGTGTWRSTLTTNEGPHSGLYHLTMDNSSFGGTDARNELTLYIDLAGWSNVVLRFWAVSLGDQPEGPPPSPFVGGADFDGVAISTDGVLWYEVQSLRELHDSYSEYVVELDAAIRAHGLSYSPKFRIRFNQFASSEIPFESYGIDDVSIAGVRTAILPAGLAVIEENCSVPNGAIDSAETVTVSLSLTNSGLGATTDLVATLLPGGGVNEPSAPQSYGVLMSGGPAVARPFTFMADGVCGSTRRATLQLRDGARDLGQVTFDFLIGAFISNRWTFTAPTPIIIPSFGPATPYPSSNIISGVTGTVRKVTVTLHEFSHTFPDHVDVLLVGPIGQKLPLFSDAGGSFSVTNVTLTFDSTVPTPLPDNGQIVSGTYKTIDYEGADTYPAPAPPPSFANTLAIFNGQNMNGVWRLFVNDDTPGEAGSIAGGWSVNIETGNSICCSNTAAADLALSITDSPDPAQVERNVVYTLQLANFGPGVATGVILTNPVPAGATFVSATAPQGVCTNDNGLVRCAFGTLASNSSVSATITFKTLAAGALINRAGVAANEPDPVAANNLAIATTDVRLPFITAQNVSVVEGNSGTTNAIFALSLNFSISDTVRVHYATADLSARAGLDYVPGAGEVVFLPGVLSQTVGIPVLGDTLDETNETFALTLFSPVNAVVSTPQATATIVDDDPSPALSINDVTVTEGDSGLTPATFNVRLAAVSGAPVQVFFGTGNGTATAPSDYLATNGTIVLLPGQTNQPITVRVVGDRINELNETFSVNLISSSPVTDALGVATIVNDDFLPNIILAGASLRTESCFPTNGVIDPNENVTVRFTLRNAATGTAATTNLVATLLSLGGVTAPSEAQTYGAIPPGSQLANNFTFTATGQCGGIVKAVLALQDGPIQLGTVTNLFTLGKPVLRFSENFDTVTAPALPQGWVAALAGAGVAWRTTSTNRETVPNSVVTQDPNTTSTNYLTSPSVPIESSQAQLTFRHSFNTEFGYDGGILEISADGGPFVDIVTAGGRFIAGGYNNTIGFDTPAWSGDSGGFTNVIVNLPVLAAGQSIRFRWRFTSDSSTGGVGWFVDTISLSDGIACCTPPPVSFQSISLQGSVVTLQWAAVPGTTYRVEYKPALEAPTWIELAGYVVAAGTSATKTDLLETSGQRFYRVVEVPQ